MCENVVNHNPGLRQVTWRGNVNAHSSLKFKKKIGHSPPLHTITFLRQDNLPLGAPHFTCRELVLVLELTKATQGPPGQWSAANDESYKNGAAGEWLVRGQAHGSPNRQGGRAKAAKTGLYSRGGKGETARSPSAIPGLSLGRVGVRELPVDALRRLHHPRVLLTKGMRSDPGNSS
jgi:hypothetical protein